MICHTLWRLEMAILLGNQHAKFENFLVDCVSFIWYHLRRKKILSLIFNKLSFCFSFNYRQGCPVAEQDCVWNHEKKSKWLIKLFCAIHVFLNLFPKNKIKFRRHKFIFNWFELRELMNNKIMSFFCHEMKYFLISPFFKL